MLSYLSIRLGIDGIVDILQAFFAAISGTFRIRVSENITKYVDIVRMISSIPSLICPANSQGGLMNTRSSDKSLSRIESLGEQ
jgi:hypothetical protein